MNYTRFTDVMVSRRPKRATSAAVFYLPVHPYFPVWPYSLVCTYSPIHRWLELAIEYNTRDKFSLFLTAQRLNTASVADIDKRHERLQRPHLYSTICPAHYAQPRPQKSSSLPFHLFLPPGVYCRFCSPRVCSKLLRRILRQCMVELA